MGSLRELGMECLFKTRYIIIEYKIWIGMVYGLQIKSGFRALMEGGAC